MSTTISGLGMMPQAMTGASMRKPPAQKMSNLFDQIDASGSGSISKAQFGQAFSTLNPPAGFKSMGVAAVFAKLDPKGTGSVSKQDFINGMTSMMSEIRQQRHQPATATQPTTPAQTIEASQNQINKLMVGLNINTTA